jgi:hypothetical protein
VVTIVYMTMETKLDIFKNHLAEWLACRGDRKKRGRMAKEISRIAKVHIKSVGRSFGRVQMKDKSRVKRRGRKTLYTPDVRSALYDVWKAANSPCGENLKPMIKDYVQAFKDAGRWQYSQETTDKLLAMSLGTMKVKVKDLRLKYSVNRGLSSTKPSNIKSIIPVFKGPWTNLGPGYGQLDTVAHCGSSLSGDFVYTLSYIDAELYWGVRRAQWNKGQLVTKNNMVFIKNNLPFKWIMGHPDTGSEFINWINKEWFDNNGISLTRSEPGKKNDNMFIEERNGHIVRKYLGWNRLDVDPAIVDLINDYYEILDLYVNHFQAVRRTLSKERIGAKYCRTFEQEAMTPYQRLMNHHKVPKEVKKSVERQHNTLNPLLLKEKLDMLETKVFKFQKEHGLKNNKL